MTHHENGQQFVPQSRADFTDECQRSPVIHNRDKDCRLALIYVTNNVGPLMN
jgi:hypothetical protein